MIISVGHVPLTVCFDGVSKSEDISVNAWVTAVVSDPLAVADSENGPVDDFVSRVESSSCVVSVGVAGGLTEDVMGCEDGFTHRPEYVAVCTEVVAVIVCSSLPFPIPIVCVENHSYGNLDSVDITCCS